MEPKFIEESQMVGAGRFTRRTYAENQREYIPLPTVVLFGPEGRVISRFTFTPEERAAIAAGEDLYLSHLTFGGALQPILPTVGIVPQILAAQPGDPTRTH